MARTFFTSDCVHWLSAGLLGLCLTGCEDLKTFWPQAPAPQAVPTAAAAPVEPPPPASNLGLQLHVGDRFPLQKTVVQTLIQPSAQGEQRSSSQLDLLLSLNVMEQPAQGDHAHETQLGVTYHRVRYQRDIGAEQIRYDSDAPTEHIPVPALGYHGMVGKGFSFWLGADHQIKQLVGFDDFVKECLTGIEPKIQAEAWASLASQSGADGIASFVDDSIGLLPDKAVSIGDSWTIKRRADQPVPMLITTQYKLRDLSDTQAEVTILGTVAPSATLATNVQNQSSRVELSVKGGRAYGGCTIDRRTGLPIHSQVEQNLSMQVKLGNGEEFTQHKQTITTIRAFPESEGSPAVKAPVAGRSTTPTVRRAAARETQRR